MAKKRKASSMPAAMPAEDDSWRARDDLHTLQRATEITGDTSRMKAARTEADRQKRSLERISRLEGKKL